jgi:hypothetical protein
MWSGWSLKGMASIIKSWHVAKNAPYLSLPFIMDHFYVKWVGHGEISVIYFSNCT